MRVALVGCGFMGRMHAQVYGVLDGVELALVVDKDPAVAAQMAEKTGAKVATFAEALADPTIDAIDICLPTHLHAKMTVQALEAGKHAVCEKPMALSTEEAQTMIEAAAKANRTLMIAHCIRFWPEYVVLKELVDTGRLGRLLSLNLTRFGAFPSWTSEGWIAKEELSGGGALDMHIHDTDYALFLMGKPDTIYSRGSIDEHGPSHIFTTMTFGKSIIHAQGGWNLPAGSPFKMAFRAVFERGAAIWDGGPLTVYEEGKDPVCPEIAKMSAGEAGGNISDLGGYAVELKYFYDSIQAGKPVQTATPQSSLDSLVVCLEEIRQAKS